MTDDEFRDEVQRLRQNVLIAQFQYLTAVIDHFAEIGESDLWAIAFAERAVLDVSPLEVP